MNAIAEETATDLADVERLERRRWVRHRIAQAEVARQRMALIDQEIARIDARLEHATAEHAATCGPAQTEITDIDAKISTAIMERKPINPEWEARAELLSVIATANEVLEVEATHVAKIRLKTDESRYEFLRTASELQAARNDLAKPDIARPDLFDAHFATQQACNWSLQRVEAAKEQIGRWEYYLEKATKNRDASGATIQRARVRRWQVELAAAESALREATTAATEAYQQMIDE